MGGRRRHGQPGGRRRAGAPGREASTAPLPAAPPPAPHPDADWPTGPIAPIDPHTPLDPIDPVGTVRLPRPGGPATEPARSGATVWLSTAPAADARVEHLQAALLAAVVTAALVPAATAGPTVLVAVVAAVQVVLVLTWLAAWSDRLDPAALLTALPAAVAAVAADVALLHRDRASLGAVLGVLAVAFLVTVVAQLQRRAPRERVTETVASLVTVTVAATALGALLVIRRHGYGTDLTAAVVLTTGTALAVGHLTDAVGTAPRFAATVARGLPALLLGALAGAVAAVGWLHGGTAVGTTAAGFLGAAMGLVTGLTAVGTEFAAAGHRRGARWGLDGVRILLPFALVVPVGYVLSQAVGG